MNKLVDIRRYGLMAALAVVSYLLIQQWSADHNEADWQRVTTQAPVNTTDATELTDTAVLQTPDTLAKPAAADESVARASNTVRIQTDVLAIEVDLQGGDIVQAHLLDYPVAIERQDLPFTLLEKSSKRTFVVQSGLLAPGYDQGGSRTPYQLVSQSLQLQSGQDQIEIVLRHVDTNSSISVDKVLTLRRGDYTLDIEYRIDNQSDQMLPVNWFGQIIRDGSKDPSLTGGAIGLSSYLGGAITTEEKRYRKLDFGEIEQGFKLYQTGGWLAFLQHYFLTAWILDDQAYAYDGFAKNGLYYLNVQAAQTLAVEPAQTAKLSSRLYLGPKDQVVLADLADNLELTVDYGFLWWAAQPLFWILTLMYSWVGNWGWSIILMTLLVKLAFFPLTAASYRSMARMKQFAPKIKKLRDNFGDDRQKLSQEMMKLYREEKINPMGGCLPMLVQMPVFIALYWVLLESVELRQSPWIGWINDLSVKDPIFVLPILMGISMFVQMRLTQQPGMDPMQQRVMQFMPIVFTLMFLFFPSGLVLYWLVNNLISIAQQQYINRKLGVD